MRILLLGLVFITLAATSFGSHRNVKVGDPVFSEGNLHTVTSLLDEGAIAVALGTRIRVLAAGTYEKISFNPDGSVDNIIVFPSEDHIRQQRGAIRAALGFTESGQALVEYKGLTSLYRLVGKENYTVFKIEHKGMRARDYIAFEERPGNQEIVGFGSNGEIITNPSAFYTLSNPGPRHPEVRNFYKNKPVHFNGEDTDGTVRLMVYPSDSKFKYIPSCIWLVGEKPN